MENEIKNLAGSNDNMPAYREYSAAEIFKNIGEKITIICDRQFTFTDKMKILNLSRVILSKWLVDGSFQYFTCKMLVGKIYKNVLSTDYDFSVCNIKVQNTDHVNEYRKILQDGIDIDYTSVVLNGETKYLLKELLKYVSYIRDFYQDQDPLHVESNKLEAIEGELRKPKRRELKKLCEKYAKEENLKKGETLENSVAYRIYLKIGNFEKISTTPDSVQSTLRDKLGYKKKRY